MPLGSYDCQSCILELSTGFSCRWVAQIPCQKQWGCGTSCVPGRPLGGPNDPCAAGGGQAFGKQHEVLEALQGVCPDYKTGLSGAPVGAPRHPLSTGGYAGESVRRTNKRLGSSTPEKNDHKATTNHIRAIDSAAPTSTTHRSPPICRSYMNMP